MRFLQSLRQKRICADPRIPEGLRVYAIGDIHGRLDLLAALQERMIEDARDAGDAKLIQIFVGDYVDRGPDARGVIDWLLTPPPEGWDRICLKGNHEAMLLDFLDNPQTLGIWQRYGGVDTLHSYGVDMSLDRDLVPTVIHREFLQELPRSHRQFMSDLRLSATIGDYFFAHAGVRPHRHLDRQQAEDLLWIREDFMESREDFGKVVVHGHSPTEEPEFLPNRINIDTGAYITGRLLSLVLQGAEKRTVTASMTGV